MRRRKRRKDREPNLTRAAVVVGVGFPKKSQVDTAIRHRCVTVRRVATFDSRGLAPSRWSRPPSVESTADVGQFSVVVTCRSLCWIKVCRALGLLATPRLLVLQQRYTHTHTLARSKVRHTHTHTVESNERTHTHTHSACVHACVRALCLVKTEQRQQQ